MILIFLKIFQNFTNWQQDSPIALSGRQHIKKALYFQLSFKFFIPSYQPPDWPLSLPKQIDQIHPNDVTVVFFRKVPKITAGTVSLSISRRSCCSRFLLWPKGAAVPVLTACYEGSILTGNLEPSPKFKVFLRLCPYNIIHIRDCFLCSAAVTMKGTIQGSSEFVMPDARGAGCVHDQGELYGG